MNTIVDNFRLAKKASLDDRQGVFDEGSETQRPYETVAEANGAVPAGSRYEGLIVLVKAVGSFIREYWYKGGILDSHLVPKNNWEYLSFNADSNYLYPANNMTSGFVVKSTAAVTGFKIGLTPGGSELSGGTINLTANVSYPVLIPFFTDVNTTIYFSGVGGNPISVIILNQ